MLAPQSVVNDYTYGWLITHAIKQLKILRQQMASIKTFFEKNLSQTAQIITPEALKQLFPIRNLSDEILESFAANKQLESIAAGTVLYEVNQAADCAIYLLKGTVKLADQNGKSYEISAGSAQAKFPICSGEKHTTTATAKTDIGILRVSLKIMTTSNRSDHGMLEIPHEYQNNRLLTLFANFFQDHELEIPTLPEVARRLRKAIENDVDVAEAVKIIQLDPVISAKLIEVANCPLYVMQFPARNCLDAVRRIGLNATRNLVVALSTKQVFHCKSSLLKQHLEELWKQSLYLSMLSHVLAKSTGQQNPEDALLAGLVCDIGALPFFSFVSNLPAEYISDKEILQAIPILKGFVGSVVLKEWGFPKEFIDVALNSSDWFQNSSPELTLADIVVLSRLHALIGKRNTAEIPAITAIPAASKLKNLALSPENSLAILHAAKQNINAAMRIFTH
jgi:HD-like signal output (HDOD) protein